MIRDTGSASFDIEIDLGESSVRDETEAFWETFGIILACLLAIAFVTWLLSHVSDKQFGFKWKGRFYGRQQSNRIVPTAPSTPTEDPREDNEITSHTTVTTRGGQIAVWPRPKNFGLAKIQTKTKIWSESMKTKLNDLQIFFNRLQFNFKVYLQKIRLFLKS